MPGAGPVALPLKPLHHVLPHRRGRKDEMVKARGQRVAGQQVEQLRHVLAEFLLVGEQAEIGVDTRRLVVVIPRTQVTVPVYPLALPAHDQAGLAVDLDARYAVDDMSPRLLQLPGPLDIRGLVEPGL